MIKTAKKLFWGWAILLSLFGVKVLQTMYQAGKKVVE